jgi:hypothetical protein
LSEQVMKDPEDIVRQMQLVRRDVGDDVKGIVETAKTLSDWRYHVKHHPWVCLGAALALGFLIARRKRKIPSDDAKELIALLKKYNVGVAPPPNSGKGLARTLIGLAAPVVMRTVLSAAQQRFNGARFEAAGDERQSEYEDYNVPR